MATYEVLIHGYMVINMSDTSTPNRLPTHSPGNRDDVGQGRFI